MQTIGQNQGSSDQSGGYPSRVTVLDFGAQQSDGSGSVLPGGGGNVTTAQIKGLAETYASNWFVFTGSDDFTFNTIVIGTNNSIGSSVTSSNGTVWADMVDSLNTWASNNAYTGQLSFHGGMDIEPSWGGTSSATNAIAWSNAYNSASAGGFMYDFGSADGCPQTTHTNGSCNNGWSQKKIYNVSYQTPDALPLPEIYGSGQVSEWTQISWYVHLNFGSYQISGPLNEHEADSSTYDHTQAWNNLWSALNDSSHPITAQNFSANVNINWE